MRTSLETIAAIGSRGKNLHAIPIRCRDVCAQLGPGCSFQIIEQHTVRAPSPLAGPALPAPDDGVDVGRIELDAAAAPSDLLGCDQSGAATQEWVQDDVAAPGRIQNGV